MQAYHPDQQQYFTTQYAQPQTTYYTQYGAYPQYLQPQPGAAPFPVYNPNPAQYEPHSDRQQIERPQIERPHATPAPRRKKLSRNAATAPAASTAPNGAPSTKIPNTPSRPAAPLKSAMKKHRTPSNGSALSRQQSNPESQRMRVNSLTRQRSNSQPEFIPEHLFVSFYSTNEMRVENIAFQSTLDSLREEILPMWPENAAMDVGYLDKWRVRFVGRPWSSVGTDEILAQRLVCRLWTVLAGEGYSYLTTVNTGSSSKAPHFVFVHSPVETAHFFMITFSRSSEKVTLIDVPHELAQQLAAGLRSMYPRRISSYGATEDGIHIIEVKKGFFSHMSSESGPQHVHRLCPAILQLGGF